MDKDKIRNLDADMAELLGDAPETTTPPTIKPLGVLSSYVLDVGRIKPYVYDTEIGEEIPYPRTDQHL